MCALVTTKSGNELNLLSSLDTWYIQEAYFRFVCIWVIPSLNHLQFLVPTVLNYDYPEHGTLGKNPVSNGNGRSNSFSQFDLPIISYLIQNIRLVKGRTINDLGVSQAKAGKKTQPLFAREKKTQLNNLEEKNSSAGWPGKKNNQPVGQEKKNSTRILCQSPPPPK